MLLRAASTILALTVLCTPALAQRPLKTKVPAAVSVTNARAADLMELTLTSGDKIARLSKPVATARKASVKLPRGSGCTVQVWGAFADGSAAEMDLDVCQDSTVRFVD